MPSNIEWTDEDMDRAKEDHDTLLKVSAIFNAWANGDEPEGQASSRRCMLAIGEILGDPIPVKL